VDSDSDSFDYDNVDVDWSPDFPADRERNRKGLLSRFISFVVSVLALAALIFVFRYLGAWSVDHVTNSPPIRTESAKQ
jgi:hypothetical protein